MIPPAADLWLYHQFADGSTQHKHLSAQWSPSIGWTFIEPETNERSQQALKELCARAAQGLPQDGIRESWVVYLDRVREFDRTKKEGPHATWHIRQKRIAADRKEVEDRQSQGAVPGQITYIPYVRTVEVPVDQEAPLTELRSSFLEQLLQERDGPLYECTYNTFRIDDIYGACAVYWLHLMAAGSNATSSATEIPTPAEPAPSVLTEDASKAGNEPAASKPPVEDDQTSEDRPRPGRKRSTTNLHKEVEPYLARVTKAAGRRIRIQDFCWVAGSGSGDDTYFGYWRQGSSRCPESWARRFERTLALSEAQFLTILKERLPNAQNYH